MSNFIVNTTLLPFFSGHRSWVEKIRGGTEYSYYHGTVFSLQPFIDIDDVRRLIQTRLVTYLYMLPADNPWTDSGLEKLLEVTGGVPRKLLEMAATVMNKAFRKKASSIGPGIVEDALVKEEYIQDAKEYLRTHFQTYIKLKQAITKKIDSLLYIFYEMPRYQIPKIYDYNMAERTTHLGIELSDAEWNNSIRTLINLECIQDGGVLRELSPDIAEFLDKFSDSPAEIPKVIRAVIREVGEIKPPEKIIPPPPNYKQIIDRILENSRGEWLSEDAIFDLFFATTKVQMYVKKRKPRKPQQFAKKIFDKEFKRYIADAYSSLMIFEDKGEVLYQKLPVGLSQYEYEQLKKLESRTLIDMYIDLVLNCEIYDKKPLKN